MERLIQRFGLIPHPEGGWYRETYRASATLPGTGRSVSTAILYLLAAGQRSRLHRIAALQHIHPNAALMQPPFAAVQHRFDARRPPLPLLSVCT